MDEAGNLYGTASNGGGAGDPGAIVKLTHSGGGWVTLPIVTFNGRKGSYLLMPLAFAPDGSLYGTSYDPGDIYRATPGATFSPTVFNFWNEREVYSFSGGSDGYFCSGEIVFDASGNVYGITAFGGPAGDGTVYQWT